MTPSGLLHSGVCGSKAARASPQLFAAYHALLRPSVPRHPPPALATLPLTSTPSARDAQSRETLLILLGTRHAREPPHCTRPVTRHAFLFQTTANPKTQPDHELTRLRAAQPPPKGQPSQTHASSPCLHHLHLLTCCPCGGRRLASLHSGPVSVTARIQDVKCFGDCEGSRSTLAQCHLIEGR